MADRHVTAAVLRVARCAEREPERREALVVQRDDELGQRDALLTERLDPRFSHQLRTDLDGGEPQDRRRPGEEAADARDRVVRRVPSRTARAARTSPRSASAGRLAALDARRGTRASRVRRSGTCRCSRRRGRRPPTRARSEPLRRSGSRRAGAAAPASCAASVIARTSASAPERYATCERQTTDTSRPAHARSTSSAVGPSVGSASKATSSPSPSRT